MTRGSRSEDRYLDELTVSDTVAAVDRYLAERLAAIQAKVADLLACDDHQPDQR